jgi:nucleotide-binding universal stress UspA family protein
LGNRSPQTQPPAHRAGPTPRRENAKERWIFLKNGDPADIIVQTAKEQKCDLIVMGTHGHGGIADVLIGSTAKRVVRQSTIPVLVIRLPEALP